MRAPAAVLVARAALVIAAFACAMWLSSARYPIGLDFQGGASVSLSPKPGVDPQKLVLAALRLAPDARVTLVGSGVSVELDGGTEGDLRHVVDGTAELAASSANVLAIASAWPSWCGRDLAGAVAIAALLLWVGVAVRAHTPGLAFAATFAFAWTLALVDQLAIGGTLSMPVHVCGILLGLAAVSAARAGEGDPLARVRAAWPAGLALGVVLLASLVAWQVTPDRGALHLVHALRFARHSVFAVAPVAAACAIATTRTPT